MSAKGAGINHSPLILWVRKFQAGEITEEQDQSEALHESQAKIAALERKVGQLIMELGVHPSCWTSGPLDFDLPLLLKGAEMATYRRHRTALKLELVHAYLNGEGSLNEREIKLLLLIARGKLHKEIGDVTGMKEISFRDSARRLYKKLEVRNRGEAARIFWAAVPANATAADH